MAELTPKSIVEGLGRYVIGQDEAKRMVAIALANRERRKKLPPEMRQEIMPKNILMIGPTGVGKTEIARRLAAIIKAPFLKVEATKFTEVGYVGQDVESIARNLVEVSLGKVYQEKLKEIENKAERMAAQRLTDYLYQQIGKRKMAESRQVLGATGIASKAKLPTAKSKRQIAQLLNNHQLEEQFVEIEIDNGEDSGSWTGVERASSLFDEYDYSFDPDRVDDFLRDNFKSSISHHQKKKMRVKEARRLLVREEANKLLDFEQVVEDATKRTEEDGIVFIDEIDKTVGPKIDIGRDISGEGVQRDLLSIIEGTSVMTRYGLINTEHILFIAAGTFSQNKPAELIPEFQGRFPLRVEFLPLGQEDLERILVEPTNSLIKQYQALLSADGMEAIFTSDGIKEIARLASLMNERSESIGARRLHTIMEKVMENLSFSASERGGEKVIIDKDYVWQQVSELIKNEDLSRYIL
jgi:ATP-dependent HslUV protease ATP-binding subunit HslU